MDISRFEDTIAATATLPGTGAITVIRVSGTDALAVVDRVVTFRSGTAASAPAQTIKYGTIFRNGAAVDEVLVSVFRAPHSYTGEDSAEISCHASPYISSEILRLLCEAGVRPADPGEFTRRAFVNGKLDLAQAEAVADVILSKTESSLRVAQNQLRGGYSSHLKDPGSGGRDDFPLELELDFSEEDVEFADRPKLLGLIDATLSRSIGLRNPSA